MAVEQAQLSKARRLLRQLGGHGLVDFDEGNFSALKEQWSQETKKNQKDEKKSRKAAEKMEKP